MSLGRTGNFRTGNLMGNLLAARTLLVAAGWLASLPVAAQYVGKVTKDAKDSPELRSIAVLEWTGEEGKPSASRLVPVAVLDAGQLQDGGIYLARPEPLALGPEVEYELEQNGQPLGLFDIKNAGQIDGSWVGFGAWKPVPSTKPKPAPKLSGSDFDDAQSDTPVLHRKHHDGDPPSSGKDSGDASGPAAPSDPDRPVLHKAAGADSDTSSKTGSAADPNHTEPDHTDPDQPTLHKKSSSPDSASGSTASDQANSGQASDDPDRPTLKRPKKTPPAEAMSSSSDSSENDPDRPRLKRGKSSGDDIEIAPSLKGFPPDVQQTVAVSDAKSRPAHPWNYAWSNPEDEAKMKSAMEDMAREALGLNPPPAKAAPKRTAASTASAARAARKAAKPLEPPPPASLDNEQFRVFELAYGSGATLVLSAHTDGPLAQQKFLTLVAQPDLYGNVLVLLKNVTDGAHLDVTPRMRLVDAVDAMADNRGELLFELRGATERQFALYRVLRGQAERLFVTGGGETGVASNN